MVEWTDQAFFAARQKVLDGCIAVGALTATDIAQEVLAALTPHVEAMVREARAEALRGVADSAVEWADWLRARAEGVRRGE